MSSLSSHIIQCPETNTDISRTYDEHMTNMTRLRSIFQPCSTGRSSGGSAVPSFLSQHAIPTATTNPAQSSRIPAQAEDALTISHTVSMLLYFHDLLSSHYLRILFISSLYAIILPFLLCFSSFLSPLGAPHRSALSSVRCCARCTCCPLSRISSLLGS